MKFQALFFLMVFSCMNLNLAQGSFGNCCLGYVPRMHAKVKANVESYIEQKTDGQCNLPAIVFLIKRKPSHTKQHTRCANQEHIWVQDLMRAVDARNKKTT
ncbi:C-C motif chemokine 25b isoform X2 [Sebastes umbrosus]|uniref:C-C motif chemokine 25b isoform X2 n=1 Tax=Sebastes umbrosus TaxID=72105 RepID=UPI00189C888A|nr:C-C motif chemokine 25b isoform X2 [Sebastes umbrosus]XP_037626402.1 C-C motif chemokine 25b isoform X2 [Sebastes umbrosus]XP_037626404.1 C-C motif chemokine 25b isoform X2 [Sebastes umbrosus]XP_037626405.1 C-C motif chemokine 25b isoform X2 [Sebastes umbrosus]